MQLPKEIVLDNRGNLWVHDYMDEAGYSYYTNYNGRTLSKIELVTRIGIQAVYKR